MRDREGPRNKSAYIESVFGANLAANLRIKGLKHNEAAERIGRDPSYISRIVHGKTAPSLKVAVGLAELVGKKLDDLVTSEDIDEWLKEHLSLFQNPKFSEVAYNLPFEDKVQLIELYNIIEEKKRKFHRAKVNVITALTIEQKWQLRFILDDLGELIANKG